ncbi:MAG: DUF853 family protein [Erysipelotrichaceae bacterium]|nr:DUF853 family protein [Erysipelotrichaceae bacterium]
MIKDNKILLGKAGEKEVFLTPSMLNRHGLIAGATGTGKTVTLKVIAESLSDLGIPTVIADVKGDLTGMIVPGDEEGIKGRLESMDIHDYEVRKYPVHFYDVYQKQGHPLRVKLQDMGPLIISHLLDLTDVQQGILNIIFRAAQDMELDIIDLKDLQAMASYVGEHSKEYTLKYGNVTKQSVGAIQRKLLELESQGGDLFFGMQSIDIEDWFSEQNGYGVMNMIECEELYNHPLLYSMFLFWMLQELYERLPEVGDLDAPKIVFFFDEAHLLFRNASRQLLEKIETTVRLIRSKGVGIFFCTQNPSDIPNTVLSQLSNRIQHSLRAYTPSEIKACKMAADSFRQNPAFDTAERISNMKTGTALVSTLDEEGVPSIVEETKILPPRSSMTIANAERIQYVIETDAVYGKYERFFDPESAYELIDDMREEEARVREEEAAAKQRAKEEEKIAKQKAREAARKANRPTFADRLARQATYKVSRELVNFGYKQAKNFLKGFLK